MHESGRFAQIESGEGLNQISHLATISLTLKDKTLLPEGYLWEEFGREFSFKGQFYDITSLIQTKEGWKLTAASDEEETVLVANQSKVQHLDKEVNNSKQTNKLKVSLVKLVYDAPELLDYNKFIFINTKCLFGIYNNQLSFPSIEQISPPPEAV